MCLWDLTVQASQRSDLHLWAVLNIRLIQAKYFLTEKTLTMKPPIKGQRTEFFFHSKVLLRFRGFRFHHLFVMLLKRTVAKESAFGTLKRAQRGNGALQMDPSYSERDLNVGFSGGEKKKAEILQMLLLNPKLAILDETDSGLDVDAVRTVSKGVEHYQKNRDGALLIITHSTGILESLKVDYTHIMVNGHIVKTGDASLIDEINEHGFEKYLELYAEKF